MVLRSWSDSLNEWNNTGFQINRFQVQAWWNIGSTYTDVHNISLFEVEGFIMHSQLRITFTCTLTFSFYVVRWRCTLICALYFYVYIYVLRLRVTCTCCVFDVRLDSSFASAFLFYVLRFCFTCTLSADVLRVTVSRISVTFTFTCACTFAFHMLRLRNTLNV